MAHSVCRSHADYLQNGCIVFGEQVYSEVVPDSRQRSAGCVQGRQTGSRRDAASVWCSQRSDGRLFLGSSHWSTPRQSRCWWLHKTCPTDGGRKVRGRQIKIISLNAQKMQPEMLLLRNRFVVLFTNCCVIFISLLLLLYFWSFSPLFYSFITGLKGTFSRICFIIDYWYLADCLYRLLQGRPKNRGQSAFSRISEKLPRIIIWFFRTPRSGQCMLDMFIMCEFAHFLQITDGATV